MNRIQRFFYEYMRGRNGMDTLNKVLFVVVLILDLLSIITRLRILYSLFIVTAVFFFYRFMSRNLHARQRENARFLKFIRFNKMKYDTRDEYRYFKCKGCKRKIRVPKGKGRIEVTCPVCGYKKIHKT